MENLFNFCYEDFSLPDAFAMQPMQTMQPVETAEPVNGGEEVLKDGKKYHSCIFPGCGKIFRFKSELARHSVVHNTQRSFNCAHPGCFKTFKREDALKNHIRIHTGEHPFQCDFEGCNEGFPTKAGLRYHMLKHNGEKTFLCSYPGCGKSFLTQAQLRQHENSINFHKKLAWQIPETKEVYAPVTKVECQKEVPVDSYFATTANKKVVKEPALDDFFAPDLDAKGIEWGTQNQEEEENVNQDLQENFEKMVKVILKDNNAMKKRLDMCSTLMGLMQENNALKAKLKKVTGEEHEDNASTSESADDRAFSFLNLSSHQNVGF